MSSANNAAVREANTEAVTQEGRERAPPAAVQPDAPPAEARPLAEAHLAADVRTHLEALLPAAVRLPARVRRLPAAPVMFRWLWRTVGVPAIAIALFLLVWSRLSANIETSLGHIPGPAAVWQQANVLWADHRAERVKAAAFYERQRVRNAARLAEDPNEKVTLRKYTGKPTYIDQIFTSLRTVFAGFVLATLVAVPVGILCGLSKTVNRALNPFIQLFKPVSPLAWLPLVTMVVSALYVTSDPLFEKSFVNSAITVALCSLWPTIINTALGVTSIDKDLMNVARVLQLGVGTRLFKLVLPASLPLIFTGLRLSLGVGWMVLIAAEMLAQNPGLGKFIWDEFQNGSSESLARILVAVFTIGFVGFLLDRLMFALQSLFSFGAPR